MIFGTDESSCLTSLHGWVKPDQANYAAAGCHKVCLLQSEQSWRLKKKSMNGKSPHCLGSELFFFLDRKAVNGAHKAKHKK